MIVKLKSIKYNFGFAKLLPSRFNPVIGWVNISATLYLNSERIGVINIGFSVLDDGSVEDYDEEVISTWDPEARSASVIGELCEKFDCDESVLVSELNVFVEKVIGKDLRREFLKAWQVRLQKLLNRARSDKERLEVQYYLRVANFLLENI